MSNRRRKMSPQAERALTVHAELVRDLGYNPTIREFAAAYGTYPSGALSILRQLRSRGYAVPTRGRTGGPR